MNYDEYDRMYARIAAYRQAVIERAGAWITENFPEFTIDNTLTNTEAFNVGLAEKIAVEDGHFLVWLIHNYSEEAVKRVRVPAELLDIPESAD